jgi:DNA-binding IclR family transcriptional regulator
VRSTVEHAAQGRGLSTARSVLKALGLLAEHPEGVRAGEVAERVGKSTSTAYYLLASLCEEGFAQRDPGSGRYRLVRPNCQQPVAAPAHPDRAGLDGVLDALYRRTRKRCYLGEIRDGKLEIAGIRGRQGLPRMPGLGARIEGDAMHALAMGKVVLSLLSAEAQRRYAARGLRHFTAQTITSPNALLAELDDARAAGCATERQEFDLEFSCVAAPLFDRRGRFLATVALSVTTRTYDHERDELLAAVLDAAELSKQLQKTPEILRPRGATA